MGFSARALRGWRHVRQYGLVVLAFVCGWWGGTAWSHRAEDSRSTRGVVPVRFVAQEEIPEADFGPERSPMVSTVDHGSALTVPTMVESVSPQGTAKEVDWLAQALDVVRDPQLNPEGKTLTNDELLWLAETLRLIHEPPQDIEQLYSAAKKDFAWRLHEQGRSVSLPPGTRPQPHAGVGFAFIVDGESQPIYVSFDPREDPSTSKYSMVIQAQHKPLSELLNEYFAGL